MNRPRKGRPHQAGQHGAIDRRIRPGPELSVGLMVGAQQVARYDRGSADAACQAFCLHPVGHGQGALFEQLARGLVGILGGIGGDSAGLFGKFEIRIAR